LSTGVFFSPSMIFVRRSRVAFVHRFFVLIVVEFKFDVSLSQLLDVIFYGIFCGIAG